MSTRHGLNPRPFRPGSASLEELHSDVQNTNATFRELAHGIYPPLLRNHGLGEAMRSVTRRVSLPYQVDVDLPRRYPEEIEAAVYFCCLEAIQNAGKHAGPDASIEVRINADSESAALLGVRRRPWFRRRGPARGTAS